MTAAPTAAPTATPTATATVTRRGAQYSGSSTLRRRARVDQRAQSSGGNDCGGNDSPSNEVSNRARARGGCEAERLVAKIDPELER